jgi:hypothetical protein
MYYRLANKFDTYDYVQHLGNEQKPFYILSDEDHKVPIFIKGKPIHIASWKTENSDAVRKIGWQ